MDNLAFIIQARLGSSRLPNKLILPFYKGKGIFQLLLDKLKSKYNNPIILATSIHPENDKLVEIAKQAQVEIYRGDENNVLNRFISAAKQFQVKKIIRICSDNPFLDMEELDSLMRFIQSNKYDYDYVSYNVNEKPSILSHFGFWTEYVKLEALEKTNQLISDKYYQEHVTNYIYSHIDIFNIKLIDANDITKGRNDIRMTLDTREDFDILSEIYMNLSEKYGENRFGIKELIEFIDLNEIKYRDRMVQQIRNNTK
ncbi:cytidylyltransferase domain-containing protein [Dysgonomonas sp.]